MHSKELQLRKNECRRFRNRDRRLRWASRAIALSSRISVSGAPSSPIARRDEKLFVSEINFNDGVQRTVAADQFENLEIHNLSEG
jgi:hypothetical protein